MVAGRTHHPVWDPEACLPCGACRRACPARVDEDLRAEPDSLRGRVAREYPFPPADGRTAVAPCTAVCPLGQDVPGYLGAIARGRLDEARRIILETNPLPGVLSRLCTRACAAACVRGRLDGAVDIRGLKGVPFADDPPASGSWPGRRGDEQVVVVGSGPAGLSAAATLARAGVRVAVVERDGVPGGLLSRAVPEEALPRDVLLADVARIAAMGVAIETGARVDFPGELDALLASGVRAVILAAGSPIVARPEWAERDLPGVVDVVGFMQSVRSGRARRVRGDAWVAGEGAPAVAAARAALDLGARRARIVVPRPRGHADLASTRFGRGDLEGIDFVDRARVCHVSGERRVERVTLETCEDVHLGGGRVTGRPTGRTRTREAALVVFSGPRSPEPSLIRSLPGARTTVLGTLAVEGRTMVALPGRVFAAGEVTSGPRTVVDAVASGIRAARGVLEFIEVTP